jgi:glucokinase
MDRIILAGDIGGTKTRLMLFRESDGTLCPTGAEARYASQKYPSLEPIITDFLKTNPCSVAAACFGVPGPVDGGSVHLTNLSSWNLNETELEQTLQIPAVRLLNDLGATAASIPHLAANDLKTLFPGTVHVDRSVLAVVAPGTGLGQAVLFVAPDGTSYPLSSEGGHVSFAPNDAEEIALLTYCQTQLPRTTFEKILSGPGLELIYRFYRDTIKLSVPAALHAELANSEDKSAVIAAAGLAERYEICVRALDRFVTIFGGYVGDVALNYLAKGGVYLGGGIAPKIQQKLATAIFRDAMIRKTPLHKFVESIPVTLITDDRAAVIGAAHIAAAL